MPDEKFISRALKSWIVILPLSLAFAPMQVTAQRSVTADAPQLPVDAAADARAKKKADLARKIAERDAREAEEYSPLGSHIRDAIAGSAVRRMSKDELDRREAGKQAGFTGEMPRVPFEGPSGF